MGIKLLSEVALFPVRTLISLLINSLFSNEDAEGIVLRTFEIF